MKRVSLFSVYTDLKVKMVSRRGTRLSYVADNLSALNLSANAYCSTRHMSIAGSDLSAVVDNNVVTVAAIILRNDNSAIVSCIYLIARNVT